MARKKKTSKRSYPKGNSVFKQQLQEGTLPRAKTWGKKDRTHQQLRKEFRVDLDKDFALGVPKGVRPNGPLTHEVEQNPMRILK